MIQYHFSLIIVSEGWGGGTDGGFQSAEDHLKVFFWLQMTSNGGIFPENLIVTERPLPICIKCFQILVQFSKIFAY